MVAQAYPEIKSAWGIDPSHTVIEFAVKHMVISTVKGRFSAFDVKVDFDEANPERSSIDARIDVSSMDTKEPKRDAHLRSSDFFDAEHYPWITFTSRKVEPRGRNRYDVIGDLTIRDVTREVVLEAEYVGKAKDPWGNVHAGFTAHATVNRKDFGVTWNMALETGGFLVSDTVKISLEAELVRQVQELKAAA